MSWDLPVTGFVAQPTSPVDAMDTIHRKSRRDISVFSIRDVSRFFIRTSVTDGFQIDPFFKGDLLSERVLYLFIV
jgi:hypothetical protein